MNLHSYPPNEEDVTLAGYGAILATCFAVGFTLVYLFI